ncbi:hypothetical protein N2152v2_000938 [Parachlorella kessleri]
MVAFEQQHSAFCVRDFPQVWHSFVHAFVDASLAKGRAAPRPTDEVQPLPTVLPAVPRLVAVGDLHGDLAKTRRAFRIAGLVDDRDRWVGDQLDRGDEELEVLFWLERVQQEAARAGGAVHIMNGNHETMNVHGQFRYATQGGTAGFGRWRHLRAVEEALKGQCGCDTSALLPATLRAALAAPAPPADEAKRARIEALRPGGEITKRFFARHPTVLQVGSTVFVHGGLLPQHVEHGLERINQETQAWLLGDHVAASAAAAPRLAAASPAEGGHHLPSERAAAVAAGGGALPAVQQGAQAADAAAAPAAALGVPLAAAAAAPAPAAAPPPRPQFLSGRDAVVWSRHYSWAKEDEERCECGLLAETLRKLPGASRMVVGHTIQRQIDSACDGQVYRIDVGMSKGCRDGLPEVLEILNDTEIRRIADVAPCVKETKQEAQQAQQAGGGTSAEASGNSVKAGARPDAKGTGRAAVAATAVPCR